MEPVHRFVAIPLRIPRTLMERIDRYAARAGDAALTRSVVARTAMIEGMDVLESRTPSPPKAPEQSPGEAT